MSTRNRNPKYTVFDAFNEARRELFAVATPRPVFEAMSAFAEEPPSEVDHWLVDRERTGFRSLAFELSEEQARAFIAAHMQTPPEGWRYVGLQVEPQGASRRGQEPRLNAPPRPAPRTGRLDESLRH